MRTLLKSYYAQNMTWCQSHQDLNNTILQKLNSGDCHVEYRRLPGHEGIDVQQGYLGL